MALLLTQDQCRKGKPKITKRRMPRKALGKVGPTEDAEDRHGGNGGNNSKEEEKEREEEGEDSSSPANGKHTKGSLKKSL